MKSASKQLDFDFKQTQVKDAGDKCTIEGYANTSTKDRVGDVVLPKAFEKSLPTYLKNPVLLMNHNWEDVAGVVIHAEITDKGLYVKALISDTREDIKTLIREGCLRTFSIGYNEIDSDMDDSTKTKVVKELELLEISVVSIPANTEAMFTAVTPKATNEGDEKKETESKKTAGELKSYISMVKKAVGNELGDDGVMAVIDYFNSNGELMNEKQLIEKLRAKSAPAVAPAAPADQAAKQDGGAAAPEAKPQDQQGGDSLKELLAKVNAIGEALAQLFEKVNALEGSKPAEEPKPEDKPAEEAKADEPKPEEDKPAAEEEQEGDDEQEDSEEDEEEKELPMAEIDHEIATLTLQITQLEDANNE